MHFDLQFRSFQGVNRGALSKWLIDFITEKELVKKLREKNTENPPEGMTAGMIKRIRDSDLLDIDYFLHEDVFGEDVEDEFFIF